LKKAAALMKIINCLNGATILTVTTFNIMTFSLLTLSITIKKSDTHHNNTLIRDHVHQNLFSL